jgi:quinol monooxygenase YgiN
LWDVQIDRRIDRRKFLEVLGAVAVMPALAGGQEISSMYGLISKITLVHGKRDEMIGILQESAAGMPGCFSYVVAKDAADEDVLWVTEAWDTAASHEASLALPAVKNAIPRAKAILAGFDRIAVTTPVSGVGPVR